MNTTREKWEKHFLGFICIVAILLGILVIIASSVTLLQTISPEIRAIGTTLLSVGIIGFIFQYYFQEKFEKVGQDSYKNIEELLKREVIQGKVITSDQDYYHIATELATKNAKEIRIANFYPNPGGATGAEDADKIWLKTLKEIIKNEKVGVFTRIVLVNKKRWEWVKNKMINELEGCPNYNLYYYNSESESVPIPTMVIIDEKQKSGDREEKKNVIIVTFEKGTGLFKKGLWFTDPNICAFFIEYYDHLLKPSSKNLVERGKKKNLFNVLEKKYGRNE
jgi:hypothetical protein